MNYAKQITQSWNKARDQIIHVCHLLVQAKADLPHGEFTRMVENELPFSANTAQRLMLIGNDHRISNPAHGQLLPPSWRTLHEITKLNNDEFYEAMSNGVICPEATRKEIIAFRSERQEVANSKPASSLPNNRFSVLYLDPPWDYNGQVQFGAEKKSTKGAAVHYNTIKTDELKKWDIPSLCEDDCLLFMWTTNPHLKQAMELGEAWGFEYATVGFVWHKEKPNPGSYTMSECELCLVFKRNKIPQPRGDRNIRQFLSEKRSTHSAKPVEVLHRITKMFPKQRKLELFSRKDVLGSSENGWVHWGDELQDVE